jgi:hypothetical protein
MKKIILLLSVVTIFTGCKKEEGCTDPTAHNFNSSAEVEDGSCFGSAYSNSNSVIPTSTSSQQTEAVVETESNVSIDQRIIGTWNAERTSYVFGMEIKEIGTMTFYEDSTGVEKFTETEGLDFFDDVEDEEDEAEAEEYTFTWSVNSDNVLTYDDDFEEVKYKNDVNQANKLEFSSTVEEDEREVLDENDGDDDTDSNEELEDFFGDLFSGLSSGVTLKLTK